MATNVVRVDPLSDPLWRRLVDKTPSSVFHSPNWIQVLTDTYGWEVSACLILDDNCEPYAGIPFCPIVDCKAKRISILPFSDYCDPLVSDAQSWRVLIDQLLSEQCHVYVRCLHNCVPLADERFTLVKRAKWHGLDLRPDLDQLWHAIDDSAHRAIHKSEREGVTVRLAQSEQDLRSFFEMHLRIRKYKYGLLAQPYSFFQNIWRQFVENERGFLLLSIYKDKIVAGSFFLEWKDTLYYKFNASVTENLSVRPNDLVIWEAIRCGKKRGFKTLDFGLSDWEQEGLARYKRKFGTVEKTISFLHHSIESSPAALATDQEMRDLLGKLTKRFTDPSVPDTVTEQAGEDLYRLFS